MASSLHLRLLFPQTGVSVEVPFLESSSETITLRGEQLSLGSALTLVYEKANSVVIQEINVPAWMHRFFGYDYACLLLFLLLVVRDVWTFKGFMLFTAVLSFLGQIHHRQERC